MTRSANLAILLLIACGTGSPSSDTDDDATTSSTASTSATATTTTATTTTTASTTTTDATTTAPDPDTTTTLGESSSSSDTGTDSGGCGNASAAAGETMRMVDVQGVTRTFIVDAPPVIDPDEPLALTFVFHGNGGTGQGIQGMGLQNVPDATAHGVFVFPDGLQYMDFGVGWNGTCDEYDMELFDSIVATLSDEYCIADDRIFAAGFSWGGDMCNSLACCRGDVVRAIAPASGPEFFPFDCAETERPAARMTWSTNDAYPNELFDQTAEFYRSENGCAPTTMPIEPMPCVAYDDCTEPVIACEYEGLGHAWPPDWAEQTWAFFSKFE